LLARLRSADVIELHHPSAMDAAEAEAAWSTFLAVSRRRHWPWLVVNALVSPLTVLLAPLPGPNLVGYWFAYRAVHHLLILVGVRRVRAGRVTTRFRPAEALDRPLRQGAGRDEAAGHLAPLVGDPHGLGSFLDRQGVSRRGDGA
jgi:hypothetical protein